MSYVVNFIYTETNEAAGSFDTACGCWRNGLFFDRWAGIPGSPARKVYLPLSDGYTRLPI